jgi:hypothetical protein
MFREINTTDTELYPFVLGTVFWQKNSDPLDPAMPIEKLLYLAPVS